MAEGRFKPLDGREGSINDKQRGDAMRTGKWSVAILAASLATFGWADNHLVWRHIGYGERGAMGDDEWRNMKLCHYGSTEIGNNLDKYIGTGRYQLGHSQNRINTWFYVTPEQAGSWTVDQSFDDYMAVRFDGEWVIVNRTYTEGRQAVVEMAEGWHACEITYGDTYGGFGPTMFDGTYPIGITINGGATYKFDEANFTFGDPTATSGDFHPSFAGEAYLYASMAPVAGCRVVVEPNGPPNWLYAAPDLTQGGRFALAASAASLTSGRFLLCQWEVGTPKLPEDLNTLFDATSANGANVKVTLQGLGMTGGQLWVDLDAKPAPMTLRHLKFPVTISGLTLDGGFQNMPANSYVTATYGAYDFDGFSAGSADRHRGNHLWARSFVAHAQSRLDGWFYVSGEKAGSWKINQGWDDFMAVAIDNAWLVVNETYLRATEATVELAEGWHTFTIVFGDTTGGYGPNDLSPWPWEYPLGVSVNGGERVKFDRTNVDVGDPLADLAGDFEVTMPGEVQFYQLVLPADARLVFDPVKTTLHSHAAPQFEAGAKLAFPASYATMTKGRYLLASWDEGTSNLSIDNFDASCVRAPNAELVIEPHGLGGRAWINLDPATSVVSARWTGDVDGDSANPGNWTCTNAEGETIAGVLPDAGTTIFVSGRVSLQIPVGSTLACNEFIIDGAVELTADCDWRGLDLSKVACVSKAGVVYKEIASLNMPSGAFFGTGILPNQDTHVAMDVEVAAGNEYWFGAWNVTYNNGAFGLCNDAQYTGFWSGYGNQGGTEGMVVPNGRHLVELDRNQVKIDGETQRVFSPNDFQVAYELFLFAQNRNGSAYAHSDGTPKLYGCKIWDNDVLVRDFVPARRQSDGLLGLLERVEQKFYVPYGVTPSTDDDEDFKRSIDVKGHAFSLASCDIPDGVKLTVNDTTPDLADAGSLRLDIPEGAFAQNKALFLTGNLQLVKDGRGTFMPLVRNVDYAGGTVIASGTLQMARGATDEDPSYSPFNFKDPFGKRETTIKVMPGATLDTQGNYDMNYYTIELAGGTFASLGGRNMRLTEWGGLGNMRLTADSHLVAAGTLSHMAGTIDLGGHTLEYTMNHHYEHFRDCTIANGRINFRRGASVDETAMFQTRGNVDATTADLDFDVLMEVQHEVKVHDVWFRYGECTWGWSNADGKFLVNGTFHPCSCFFPNVVLMDGAAIDLSDQVAPVSTKSRDDTRTNGEAVAFYLTVEDGARIGVTLGDRPLQNGECLMTWATETVVDELGMEQTIVHRPPPGVSFKALDRKGECIATDSGLYYFTGLTVILR